MRGAGSLTSLYRDAHTRLHLSIPIMLQYLSGAILEGYRYPDPGSGGVGGGGGEE